MARIERDGPLRFDRFMELALYDETDGFYSSGGAAGRRRGDFITSPEVGPLFGAVVARALDQWWDAASRPNLFVVAEAAAGRGALARSILAAEPACAGALQYRLIETSASLRAEHDDLIARGAGSSGSWPTVGEPPIDVVIANELLDNLPTRVLERTEHGWAEVAVDADLNEVLIDLEGEPPATAVNVPVGARIPWAEQADAWVDEARHRAGTSIVAFDYGASTPELAERGQSGWLRGYRNHTRVVDVLASPGSADITVDVPFDQLPACTTTTQAEWLRVHGIDDLTATARTVWEAERAAGGMAAIRARSAIIEAEALTDPAGLGAFVVAEWTGNRHP